MANTKLVYFQGLTSTPSITMSTTITKPAAPSPAKPATPAKEQNGKPLSGTDSDSSSDGDNVPLSTFIDKPLTTGKVSTQKRKEKHF